jgi:deoxyribodipyrimidine photolyase-related protein
VQKEVTIVFPHQLLSDNKALLQNRNVILIEEYLFFKQYTFHKQKLAYHRATMQFYKAHLEENGFEVSYIECNDILSDIRLLIPNLHQNGISKIHFVDVVDNWLEKRINETCVQYNIKTEVYKNDIFINTKEENNAFFETKKRYFQTDFYIWQRKRLDILVDQYKQPLGGKWSFDTENRLKYPKHKVAPKVAEFKENKYFKEAKNYIATHFSSNYGELENATPYPITFEESEIWLQDFYENRLAEFGVYEDAMVQNENILHHSLLTPMLNIGLLTPKYVIEKTLVFAEENEIPINSLEGFLRQIIGWREFIKAVYDAKGTFQRNHNFWGFTNKIPSTFWTAKTGIFPVDNAINKGLSTSYNHHIERLMILGNFMLLCEFHPDEVYRWFMEMYIDAYDWVMVPNVYGMSQYADGGLLATKPYISSSNYILKMSDYPKGDWQQTWDALFWRFMDKHRAHFKSNPRLGMLLSVFDKMDENKQNQLLETAENWINSLENATE